MTTRAVTVEEGYAAWAAHYDARDNPLVAMSEEAWAHAPIDARGARVVELGCGTGRNAARLLAGGAVAYAGVDASRAMLDVARDRFAGEARVAWIEADVTRPLLAGRTFDLVVVTLVLEHVEDAASVFRAAAAIAPAAARMVAHELHPELHARGARAHVDVDGETWALPSHPHDARDLAAALAASGWQMRSATTWLATD